MRRLIPALAVLALLCAAPAGALAKTVTSSAGDVTASVTYSGKGPPFRSAKLTITQAGALVFDSAVRMPCRACGLQALNKHRVLRVRDVDGDDEPEVLLEVFSGGAHCCAYLLAYRYQQFDNTYERIVHPWGNVGYSLRDLNRDGPLEFVSADNRFAYLFTSYADSSFPLRIWQLADSGFVDATRRFGRQVRQDALRQLRRYRRALRQRRDVRGILAAFLADEYRLRRSRQGWGVLRRADATGQLRSPYGDNTGPSGKRYLSALRRFLRRAGYARR